MDLEKIKKEFAEAFIKAVSSKSIEACADLVMSDEDNKVIEINYGLSPIEYRKALTTQCANHLEAKGKFIDDKNAHPDSALTIDHIVNVDTYNFKIDPNFPANFIKTISISMNTRLIDDVNYQVGFQINDALLVNGKIRINNFLGVKMSESYWDDINENNTPYPKIEDHKELATLFKDIDFEDKDIIYNWDTWYVHEGDLVLEKYDLKVNFIVTGNLTIKEPMVEPDRPLIVFGKTTLNALNLEEPIDVVFYGGIEFKQALFINDSGPCQLFNNPQGPFIYSYSESYYINNLDGVQCLISVLLGEHKGELSKMLVEKFIVDRSEYEDEEVYGLDDLELEDIVEALKNGEEIFVK